MDRRKFLQGLGAAAAGLSFRGICEASERKPNVIIIYTDDQGSIDMNCYGAEDLKTPNMDSLAEKGVRFTQFYAAGPMCSPSRVGLLTGRTPQHGGLWGNVYPGSEGMPGKQVTIAEELKDAGYATALIGKWHLGHSEDTVPNGQGFDYFFGHLLGCMDNYSHFFYWNGPNRHALYRNREEVYRPGQYFPDLMVKEAGEFIDKNKDNPFFLYFSLNNPHYPYQGTPEWLEYYKDLPYPRNLYAAFLSTADEKIGELLKKVDQYNLRRDTIIIFQSDQGHSEEVRAHRGGGSAGPYRGHKGQLYEGGIRIPAIISWPGHLPEKEVRTQMATNCDWYPTLLELCKLPPAGHRLDGKSLMPIIKSAKAPTAHKHFHWKSRGTTVVRSGKWKLLMFKKKTELYDIPSDPGESKNLAEKHPEVVEGLKKISDDYWNSI
ncbi:sulfatase-like hydrolase/transferase [Sedimentisphaera salicampi]|uniref:Arylsulfatase n=1 Tax=Sedimentisphaera salicampi TaxID=1941349 RepID=A0A1W6LK69_9BACT|nr:sulfatase-like hydrolase/transferase [Sedimentisphaera salicampi]ARN56188.1 Arylsulfatase precursor [Sedimentisphaera salicampi]